MAKPALLSMIAVMVAAQTKAGGDPAIYEGLILGLGPGTFFVLVCTVISILCCLFKDSVPTPTLCVVLATLFPIIVLVIVASMPVENLEVLEAQEKSEPNDPYLVRTTLACVLIYVLTIVLCCILCSTTAIRPVVGRKAVSSNASTVLEDVEDEREKYEKQKQRQMERDTELKQNRGDAPDEHRPMMLQPSVENVDYDANSRTIEMTRFGGDQPTMMQ